MHRMSHCEGMHPAPGVRDVEGVAGPQEYISPRKLCSITWNTARPDNAWIPAAMERGPGFANVLSETI